jgi:hypothetical protein
MEIRDNFCHWILDPDDTDNEVFVADCAAYITVEKPETDPLEPQSLEEEKVVEVEPVCEGRLATGYAKVVKKVRENAAPLPVGERAVFTSEISDAPCVMVTSNKTYKSHDWVSSIKVNRHKNGDMVKVIYELTCYDGEERK